MPAVAIHVYDLSQGMARMMSMAIVGKQVDIIPHTGIVVTWSPPNLVTGAPGVSTEYFYGGGVCSTPSGQAMPMPTCEIIPLGETTKTEAELGAFLASISPRFTAATCERRSASNRPP